MATANYLSLLCWQMFQSDSIFSSEVNSSVVVKYCWLVEVGAGAGMELLVEDARSTMAIMCSALGTRVLFFFNLFSPNKW